MANKDKSITMTMKVLTEEKDDDLNVYENEVLFSGTNVISFIYSKERLEQYQTYNVTLTKVE